MMGGVGTGDVTRWDRGWCSRCRTPLDIPVAVVVPWALVSWEGTMEGEDKYKVE